LECSRVNLLASCSYASCFCCAKERSIGPVVQQERHWCKMAANAMVGWREGIRGELKWDTPH
jgi:hypothetical protein